MKASNPQDEVFIVNFNDEAYLDVQFTNDIKKMEEGVARIDSRGGTAMRDAISMSIDYLKEKGKKQKKVLLVVTDGNDNASTISLEKLVNRAQQSEVLIYAIGLLNEEERREAKSRQARAGCADAGIRRAGLLSQGCRPKWTLSLCRWRTRFAISTPSRIRRTSASHGRQLPADQSHGERSRPSAVRTRTGYYATPDIRRKKAVSQLH